MFTLLFFLLSILFILIMGFAMLTFIGCGFIVDLALIIALIPIIGPIMAPFICILLLVSPFVGAALIGGLVWLIVALVRKSKKKKAAAVVAE